MKNKAQGFTLLELLVVIVLLILAISVTSVSIVSGQDGAHMRTSARQIMSVLRSARTQAITEGVEAGLRLGFQDQGIQVNPPENPGVDYQSNHRGYTIIPEDMEIVLPGALSLHLTLANQPGLISPGSILFYPDGSSSGGSLALSSPSAEMTIAVDWLTGEVTLDKSPTTAQLASE